MQCPKCNNDCDRDEADVGVGIIYGPWGCYSCGWSEDSEYDSSNGPSPANLADPNRYTTPTGIAYHKERMAERLEHLGIKGGDDLVKEVFG